MKGDVLCPQQFRPYAIEAQEQIQLLGNGQIDAALRHTGDRHRAAVFPAVPGVYDHGFRVKPGG